MSLKGFETMQAMDGLLELQGSIHALSKPLRLMANVFNVLLLFFVFIPKIILIFKIIILIFLKRLFIPAP